MQTPNNPEEEQCNVLMAIEMYRLQSARNMLLIVLMIQLLLIGIGVSLFLRGSGKSAGSAQWNSDHSAVSRGNDEQTMPSDKIYRTPKEQHDVVGVIWSLRTSQLEDFLPGCTLLSALHSKGSTVLATFYSPTILPPPTTTKISWD